MNRDWRMGLGMVALMVLCCGGPLILSLLTSGAVLGGLAALWAVSRLLLVPGVVLVVGAVWLLGRRRSSQREEGAACCATPTPTAGADHQAGSAAHVGPDGRERTPASASDRSAA